MQAKRGFAEVAAQLIRGGSSVDLADKKKKKSALWAASNGHLDAVRVLLDAGSRSITQVDKDGATPLHRASRNGHPEVAELRLGLARGAEVNAVDRAGATSLMIASANGHEFVVGQLLSHDADVNLLALAHCALQEAARAGHDHVARLLLRAGASLVAGSPADGSGVRSATHLAAQHGHEEVLQVLFTAGAAVDERDGEGHTPLLLAASHGHTAAMGVLLEGGADVAAAQQGSGETALMAASAGGHEQAVSLLIDSGQRVDATRADGSIALIIATTGCQVGAAQVLLMHKADRMIARNDGATAATLAEAQLRDHSFPNAAKMAEVIGAGRGAGALGSCAQPLHVRHHVFAGDRSGAVGGDGVAQDLEGRRASRRSGGRRLWEVPRRAAGGARARGKAEQARIDAM